MDEPGYPGPTTAGKRQNHLINCRFPQQIPTQGTQGGPGGEAADKRKKEIDRLMIEKTVRREDKQTAGRGQKMRQQ